MPLAVVPLMRVALDGNPDELRVSVRTRVVGKAEAPDEVAEASEVIVVIMTSAEESPFEEEESCAEVDEVVEADCARARGPRRRAVTAVTRCTVGIVVD